MERGTTRERRLVGERWREMERRQERATALLRGLALALLGAVLLLVGVGGMLDPTCTPLRYALTCVVFRTDWWTGAVLVAGGLLSLGYGGALVLRAATGDGPDARR